MSWDEFLKTHWDVLSATDLFTVEVWHRCRLVRYLVLIVFDQPTRKVEIIGITPGAQWAMDAADGPQHDRLLRRTTQKQDATHP